MNKKIIMVFLLIFCVFFGVNSVKADTTAIYKYCKSSDCMYLAHGTNSSNEYKTRLFDYKGDEIYEDDSNSIFSIDKKYTYFVIPDNLDSIEESLLSDSKYSLYYFKIILKYDGFAFNNHDFASKYYSVGSVKNKVIEDHKEFIIEHGLDGSSVWEDAEFEIAKDDKEYKYKKKKVINVNIENTLLPSEIKNFINETKNDDDNKEKLNYDDNKGCALFSPKIKEKINWVLNLIKYGGAILVIILGSVDFLKATLSGEDNATKKAFERFIKRLIAAVLLFLLPLIIQLLFTALDNPVIKIPGFNVDNPTCGIGTSE